MYLNKLKTVFVLNPPPLVGEAKVCFPSIQIAFFNLLTCISYIKIHQDISTDIYISTIYISSSRYRYPYLTYISPPAVQTSWIKSWSRGRYLQKSWSRGRRPELKLTNPPPCSTYARYFNHISLLYKFNIGLYSFTLS